MRIRLSLILLLTLAVSPLSPVHAELVELKILERGPFARGKSFGETGPYEKIVGIARFAIDPKHANNRVIVDLDKAPRNARGLVEFESDVVLLAPKDPSKGNGAIFYDVNNRGRMLALRFFNDSSGGNELDKPGSEGNGFLMRQGFTVVWCGWIGELLAGNHQLLLKAPLATEDGKPIRGTVRFEMGGDAPAKWCPLSRRDGHGSYSPTKEGEANGVLTKRLLETDTRQPIARDQWHLKRMPIPKAKSGVQATMPQIRCYLEGGFEPGWIYELICECEGSRVMGVGLAATRDLISFLKYDRSGKNPVRRTDGKPALNRAHGFGVSQSGRFLRHFLWQGFNEDEKGRIVFDGLMPHVAGGGLGFFNARFAQPTRHNGQHEDHLYPADIFPFTYGTMKDPLSGRTDGILRIYEKEKPKCMPRVMHTQSAAEYWHRSGSLPHTDPLGKKDVSIPDNVRIYAFGGTQHGPASYPPSRGIADNLNNPGDYCPLLRALIVALDNWVLDGLDPPASRYPRIDNKTLVHWDQKSTGFPKIPGVRYPTVIQQPPYAKYGSEFFSKGIVSIEPPEVKGQYVVLVPRNGADGNDLGTLLPPEVAVPLATYTGWNLRRKEFGADGMLASLRGSYIPFARTRDDRQKSGDPRESLAERYGTFAMYQSRFITQCNRMVIEGYLLKEDAARLIAERKKHRDMFAK